MLYGRYLRGLLTELDLDADIDWKVTRTGFFTGSGLYHLNDAIDYLKFPALNLLDKFRLGLTIMYMAGIRDGRPLESVPQADWLTPVRTTRLRADLAAASVRQVGRELP